jgi:hypothetical protein
MTRPDLRDYFNAQIDQYVYGMMARRFPSLPRGVARVDGTVTDDVISATMTNGDVFRWSGGRYAKRKIRGCYAPLLPIPATEANQPCNKSAS